MKKVSIIMPCYNVPVIGLERMLTSICAQTYKEIEILMINDGSTDETHSRLEKWAKTLRKSGFEAKVFNKSNGGAASAINIGLKNYTGDYICFLDADDILNIDYIETMVTFLNNNPNYGWVRCFAKEVNENDISTIIGHIGLHNVFQEDKLFIEYLLARVNHVVWLLRVC